MSVLWGCDKQVGDYVAAQFPLVVQRGGFNVVKAVGFTDSRGRLVGGLVMTDYRGHDAELSIYLEKPSAISPQNLRELFHWAFRSQGFKRLTASISKKNKRCRRLVEGLGFRLEGTMRYGFSDGTDQCVYGMTYDNCNWLGR